MNILNNSKSTIDSLIVEDSSNLNIAEIAKTLTLNTELKINKTSQMQSLNVLGKIESKLLDIKGNFIVNPYSEINGATKVSNNLSTPNMTVNQIEVKGTTTINCESIFNNDFTVQGGTFINYGEFLVNQLTITNNIIVTNSSNFLKDVEVMGSLDIYQTCSTPDSIKGNIVTDRLSVKDKLTCKTIKVNGDDVHIIGNLPLLDLSNVNTLITNTTNTAKLDALNNSNFQTIETQNSNIIAKKLFIKDSLIAKETRMIINKDIFNWSRTELKTSILNITGDKAIDIGNHWIKGANRLTGIRIHPQGFIQIGELTNMNESDYQEYKGGDLIVNQDLVVNGLFDYKETPFTIPEIISTKNILFPLRLRKINLLSDITHDIETSYENEYYRYPTLIAKNRIGIHIDSPICRLHIGGNPDEVDYNKYVKIDFFIGNRIMPPGVYATITLEDTVAQKDKFMVYIKGMAYFDELLIKDHVCISSDKRIKHLIGKSNSISDLRTIRDIEVVDYTKIDKIKNGSRIEKKVIAQQIESIYPQAVSTKRGFIPNIYKTADSIAFLKNQMVDIHKHDIANRQHIKELFGYGRLFSRSVQTIKKTST